MRKLELVQPCDFTPAFGAPTGDPTVLRCVGCGHTVRDLSALGEDEALAFLDRREPGECVRFRVDEEDRVVFAGGAPGSLIGRVAQGARPLLAVATLALAACESRVESRAEARSEPAVTATASATATAAVVASASSAPEAVASAEPPPLRGPLQGAPLEPIAAVSASARPRALTPKEAAAHEKHRRDRVLGRTPDGRPLYELSGY